MIDHTLNMYTLYFVHIWVLNLDIVRSLSPTVYYIVQFICNM